MIRRGLKHLTDEEIYAHKRKKNNERVRTWKVRNPHWKRWLKHRYNLTLEDFSAMLGEQLNGCKICRTQFYLAGKQGERPRIDHDHKTGKIRGLLCHGCNVALGFMKERIDLLDNMKAYITAHS